MQKSILITIVVSGIFLVGQSQPLEMQWQQCFGGSENDVPYDIILHDNHYYIVGTTRSYDGDISTHNGGGSDVWLIKTDTSGNLLWEKTYGGSNAEGGKRILSSGKNLIITGTSCSSDGDFQDNDQKGWCDYFIMKIDTSGNILWDRLAGGSRRERMWNAGKTAEQGIISIGGTTSFDGDVSNYYGYWDMWAIKHDSSGNAHWDFTIGTAGIGVEEGFSVIQTSDGGYLLGGASDPDGEGNIECDFHDQADAVLFKLDTNGNEEWQRCYGGSNNDVIKAMLETEDGYLLSISGGSDDGDCEGCGYHPGYPDYTRDLWLVKTDFQGNIQWDHCYGGYEEEWFNTIFQTPKGYILFGITESTTEYGSNGDVTDNPSSSSTPTIWVIKVDTTGELLWDQCFGGEGADRLKYGVVQKNWYTYVVVASTNLSNSHDVDCSPPVVNPYEDYWLFELRDKSVGTPEIDEPESKLEAYPNPAKKQVTFSYTFPRGIQKGTLKLRNPAGAIMKRISLKRPKGEKTISTNHWSPGIYFYTLRTNQGIKSGKLVIAQ
ncbi:MAG: T9SS type A sorting domain-containing protein [Bacteroidales bacterium]|nr:T9SS type A sorting domain-containing protein [Bacteroidales bacterium]MCF8338609.1 T9SS type A sorting domain-containing protein [Bacteroidales bacterium]